MKISVLGCGRWGTYLANHFCKDNNLYQSNLNKFLHGDLSAVSLDKCRELRTYLNNL